ncbi:MAG: hypothetical protein ICV62_12920 [Cyanobacteria bacterium Co-bin13]|nr:hypothetical protein [Cyanobacteria bacterium Co-bin13]
MARSFNPVLFWLQWTLGTAVIFAIAVALFNVFGLLVVSSIGLGFWQGWLLRRWLPIWRWWVVTVGFGLVGLGFVIILALVLPLSEALFSLRSVFAGTVMGATIGLGQALVLRQQIPRVYWWILISAVALALGASWVIDLTLRLAFNMEVPYTRLIRPLAQSLLPTQAVIHSVCRYSEFSVPPPSVNPLQDPNWLYGCRAVNVGIAFLSGLIGGAIKGGGMVWLLGKAAVRQAH